MGGGKGKKKPSRKKSKTTVPVPVAAPATEVVAAPVIVEEVVTTAPEMAPLIAPTTVAPLTTSGTYTMAMPASGTYAMPAVQSYAMPASTATYAAATPGYTVAPTAYA